MKRGMALITAILTLTLASCACNTAKIIEIHEIDIANAYISESDYSIWNDSYLTVIESWRQAISEDFGSDYSENSHGAYPFISQSFNVSDWLTADTYYAYYDIDANGSAELLIAGYEKNEDWYYLYDIYALKNGHPVRLLESLTDNGFDRDIDLLYIYPDTGTVTYPINDGDFNHCQMYCQIAPDGYSAQYIEAFNSWDRKEWTYYPGSLSPDNAKTIAPEEGNELLSKYGGETTYQQFVSNLVWKELAPSAISKDAEDYLHGYQPLTSAPPEYAEVIECCRKTIIVFDNVYNQGYSDEIIYNLLDGSDAISFEAIGKYTGGGLYEPLWHRGTNSFGYAAHDINGDGTKELLLMYIPDGGEPEVFDIFTVCNGRVKHLLDFQPRNYCTGISEDGFIYRCASGGAACQTFYAYTITSGGETLNYEAVHRCDGNYTYFSAQDIVPGNSDQGTDGQSLSSEEGEELILRLTDEGYSDSDAPFAEFIPMF